MIPLTVREGRGGGASGDGARRTTLAAVVASKTFVDTARAASEILLCSKRPTAGMKVRGGIPQ